MRDLPNEYVKMVDRAGLTRDCEISQFTKSYKGQENDRRCPDWTWHMKEEAIDRVFKRGNRTAKFKKGKFLLVKN